MTASWQNGSSECRHVTESDQLYEVYMIQTYRQYSQMFGVALRAALLMRITMTMKHDKAMLEFFCNYLQAPVTIPQSPSLQLSQTQFLGRSSITMRHRHRYDAGQISQRFTSIAQERPDTTDIPDPDIKLHRQYD